MSRPSPLAHKLFMFMHRLTVNDLISARDVYLILGIHAGAFKIERRLFS